MTGETSTPSRASVLGWTLWTACILDVATAAVLCRNAAIGMLGLSPLFLTVLVGSMGVTRPISVRHRLLRAVSGLAIAAVWPVAAWMSTGNLQPLRVLGIVAATFAVLWLMSAGHEFVERRGWIVRSPWRGRIQGAVVLLYLAMNISNWPTGPFRETLSFALFVVFLLAVFWRPRQRGAVSGPVEG